MFKRNAFWLYYFYHYLISVFSLLIILLLRKFIYCNFPLLFEYINLFLIVLICIPIINILRKYLSTYFEYYHITKDEMILFSGILIQKADHLNCIRIKDIRVERPYYLKLFNRANVVVIAPSDATDPILILKAINNYEEIVALLSERINYILEKSAPLIAG